MSDENRWEIIGPDASRKFVLCRCKCGTERRVNKQNLKQGLTKSCGCLKHEKLTSHGKSRTRTYRIWQAMRDRTTNLLRYVEKGIKVCDRWNCSDGFKNFLADMGECPSNDHSIDRFPDNDGDYEPGNCRWATSSQQQRHKSTTVQLTFDGRTQSLADWAEEIGLSYRTLWGRILRKWTVERALTTPEGKQRGRQVPPTAEQMIAYNGRTQSVAEWAQELNLTIETMINRLYDGWPMVRIVHTPQGKRGGHKNAERRRTEERKLYGKSTPDAEDES